ncbi:jmjc domain-containing protein 4 [Nannochloropsis oceanica]
MPPPDPSDHDTANTSISSSIARIDFAAASVTLLRAYLDANVPFILVNVASNWRAMREWVAPGEEEDFVTIDLLQATFRGRDVLVPVVECHSGNRDENDDAVRQQSEVGRGNSKSGTNSMQHAYGEEPRRERTLTEYAALWRSGEAEARRLYMKDWHIVKALRAICKDDHISGVEGTTEQHVHILSSTTTATVRESNNEDNGKGVRPDTAANRNGSTSSSSMTPSNVTEALASFPYYIVPSPLDDDWLNDWWDAPAMDAGHAAREDDFRFLYLGPAGSTTGVHHDVLCSYSWSVNLAGSKEWTLYPPASSPPAPFTTSSTDLPTAEPASMHEGTVPANQRQTQSLGFRPTSTASAPDAVSIASPFFHPGTVPTLVVRQGPGELMFVPSGWHHKVRNLTSCLSINHNWFNRSSLARVWAFLKEEASAVQEKLGHLRETFDEDVGGWERQCEVVLRANSAMNLTEWVGMLMWKAREFRRVGKIVDRDEARQDLEAILGVLREVASAPKLVDFLFPPHLERGNEQAEEGVPAPRLPLRIDLLPSVEAWLAAEIRQIEASLELIGM